MSVSSDNAADIAALNATVATIKSDSQNFWLIWAGVLVFSIQLGFMCHEVGTVRLRNTRNILIKNMMDTSISALFYWGFGYAFAFGQSTLQDNKKTAGFIGDSFYFYSGNPENLHTNFSGYSHMFYSLALAGVASSIVSGAMAERAGLMAFFLYSAFLTGFVYPVVSHWVWATPGFLCPWHEFRGESDLWMDVGVIDFGGSGVVHLTGATAAAWGAWWLGPRRGRYDADGNALPQPNHSQPMQMMGATLIWAGWYAMNIGSVFTTGDSTLSGVAGRVALTTTLSASAGGVTSLIWSNVRTGEYTVNALINGMMAGLVSISAGCATVAPWAAFVIGILSTVVYNLGSWLTVHLLRIDDVSDAVAVHGWCGIWGCVAAALFSRPEEMMQVYGSLQKGILYGGGNMLAANFGFTCLVVAWVSGWMCLFFGVCYYAGVLRISEQEEDALLDGIELVLPKTVDIAGQAVPTSEDDVGSEKTMDNVYKSDQEKIIRDTEADTETTNRKA